LTAVPPDQIFVIGDSHIGLADGNEKPILIATAKDLPRGPLTLRSVRLNNVPNDRGEKVTDDYAALRSELLIESLKSIANLDERLTDTTQFMSVLTGIYEEMSRSSATYTHTSGQE